MHSGGMLAGWKFSNFKDGVFSEFFHVNDADGNLALLPSNISPVDACMLSDMVPTGFHGVELADVQFGDTVLVIGIGPVGLMVVAGANMRGASRIIAVGTRPVCVAAAKKYGGIYVPANQSVIHSYAREQMAKCGSMILGSDSHTRYGALGTMAVGEGGPELAKQLLKNTWDTPMPKVVLVYLTGGRLLRITPEELLRFDLRPGMDLAEDVLEELNRAAARSLTRQQAAEMAGRRMLSQKELSDRLVKKGTDPQEAQETAQWLADLGAVDDAAYAGVIVRHYAAMGYGPGRVRQELQHRGVPRELWDDALARMPDPEEAIDRFLTAKLRGKTPDRATLQRLSAALQRRGFSWQDIRPALARLDREPED